MATPLRIATFNLENFDDKPGEKPTLDERIKVMRPQLQRLRADVVCLQEVNAQEKPGHTSNNPQRELRALDTLLAGTEYASFHRVSTLTQQNQPYDERNLVVLSRFPITHSEQFWNRFVPEPMYRVVTARPEEQPKPVRWERPILHATLDLSGKALHVVVIHLKSKIPVGITGQGPQNFSWNSISGWAEGFFLSSMKRVGQALETRMLVDSLFDQDPEAQVVVLGDFNADSDEVPVQAIRGDIENTGNAALATRVMVPCERTIPEPSRFSLYHQGRGEMIDHLLVSRNLLAFYRSTEIHNELLHDESLAFATDPKFPESDHAPVVAEFSFP